MAAARIGEISDVPEVLETERLLIRAPRPGDGAELYRAVRDSHSELRSWMPWATHVPTLEEAEENLRQARAEFLERIDLRLLLFLKGTETLVGSSGLHRIDWSIPAFEIGYWCRTAYVGQGYITEAARGITGFAFSVLGARRVALHCDPRNTRSRRVAERVGFRPEGTLRNSALDAAGEVRDTLVFSLIPEECAALRLEQAFRLPEPV